MRVAYWSAVIFCVLLIASNAAAKYKHKEKWYQDIWCEQQGGKTEVVLPDGARCDCLTDTNAVEFDYGKKWAESIGQSLYYSAVLGKRAGIVLILEDPKDSVYVDRLRATIKHFNLPIDYFEMRNY